MIFTYSFLEKERRASIEKSSYIYAYMTGSRKVMPVNEKMISNRRSVKVCMRLDFGVFGEIIHDYSLFDTYNPGGKEIAKGLLKIC